MGLDTVELIMALEEEFDIEIPDEDAEKLVTVGAMHEYVCKKLEERAPHPHGSEQRAPCMTSHVFYRLRSALEDSGLAGTKLSPRTSLSTIFSGNDPRKEYKALEERLGLKLPQLVRPVWLIYLIVALSITASAAVYLALPQLYGWILTPLTTVSTAVILVLATKPAARCFPRRSATLRNLTYAIFTLNRRELRPEPYNAQDKHLVWDALKAIIVEQLGVREEQVIPAANIVTDLGAD